MTTEKDRPGPKHRDTRSRYTIQTDLRFIIVALLTIATLAWVVVTMQQLAEDRDALAQQVERLGGTPVAGPPGDRGESVTGPPGPSGRPGRDATPAKDGRDGEDGKDGADSTVPGPTGPPGQPGADSTVPGPTGPAGQPGKDGKDGKDGQDGQSCPDGYSLQPDPDDENRLECRKDPQPSESGEAEDTPREEPSTPEPSPSATNVLKLVGTRIWY